ncbi:MAG: RidA family protein [Herpetosiphon sp.]
MLRFSSGGPWEARFGYSRAVRVGDVIYVAGTTAVGDEGDIDSNDAYLQTRQALRSIERAINALGASITDVVRTRMFVIHMDDAEAVGRAHGEVFGLTPPVATMIEVSRLIDSRMLVEIEAEAVVVKKEEV